MMNEDAYATATEPGPHTQLPGGIVAPKQGIDLPPLEQWQFAPYLQWSMQNIAQFLPVHAIPRGDHTTAFGSRPEAVGELVIKHPWEERSATFSEVMGLTHTDGWMVCHRDEIIAEEYTGTFTAQGLHLLMSISKSLTATVAGVLAHSGTLDMDGLVTDYVPELKGSGYEGATVRHLVDMRTGINFSEEYLDETAEVRLLEEALGWAPRRHPHVPDTLLGFLATLRQSTPHGGPFDYKSCETDVLGFVIEGATGTHPAEVMSKLLWQPMGAGQDAHVGVDRVDGGMFDGGVSSGMRDIARFGSLFLHEGAALDGTQVLPKAWVDDTFAGGADSREAFARAPEPTFMPGGMYRNGFWFPSVSGDVMLGLGIHGQMLYVDRVSGMLGVKFSSWTTPQDPEKLFWTVRAFDAASYALHSGSFAAS